MVLENGFLRAEVNAKGAELKSLRSTSDGYEYLWSADPAYWAKTSPVLFPIVGALKDNNYYYAGEKYEMLRHGFARDHFFEGSQLSDDEALFVLKDTKETRISYPFAFRLSLRYALIDHSLRCTYEVHNPSNDHPLFFSVGGHPAFAVGSSGKKPVYQDHYLEFSEDHVLDCHVIDQNLISDHMEIIALDHHRLPLKHDLFYNDALVLKTLKSPIITLRNRINDHGIHVRREGFPYFGIWAAKDADFVCLEPWCGIADSIHHNQRLEDKEGIQRLDAGETWMRSWEVACF